MEITRDFLIDLGGYEVMLQARSMVERGTALSSQWKPPVLKGIVEAGGVTYQSGLVVKSKRDVENLCTCMQSRRQGLYCVHSIAVGLHFLQGLKGLNVETAASPQPVLSEKKSPSKRSLRRVFEGEGEPLMIHVLLPPNFEQSIGRGKTTLYFEAQTQKGRCPLGSLPLDVTYRLSVQDVKLLNSIEQLSDGNTPMMLPMDTAQLAETLRILVNHPRVTIGKMTAVQVSDQLVKSKWDARLEANGEITLERLDQEEKGIRLVGATTWIYRDQTFFQMGIPVVLPEGNGSTLRLTRQEVPIFLSQKWGVICRECEITSNFKLEDFVFDPTPPKFRLEMKGGLARLEAILYADYAGQEWRVGGKGGDFWMPDPSVTTKYSTRDPVEEGRMVKKLHVCGFVGPDHQGVFILQGQSDVLQFLAGEFQRLQKTLRVQLDDRLERSIRENVETIEPRFEYTPSGEQWFDLDVKFETSQGEKFTHADIQEFLRKGQGSTRLKNGRLGVINQSALQDFQELLVDIQPEQEGKGYRIRGSELGYVDRTIRNLSGWSPPTSEEWRERAARQSGEVAGEMPSLGHLDSILRPYQKEGLGWLAFLRENRFGGILADEMGLGKTVQVLAFLDAMRREGKISKPCLIVCPTSLVMNWQAESAHFTPDLRVWVLHGPDRMKSFDQIPNHDLVITSYALLRRDADRYKPWEWDTVILDEAQHIKNRQSLNAQSVKSVRSDHRLVLTGTPMENSVLDLWSLFDFLMPGYLGTARDFKDRYEGPIVRDRDARVQSRLGRRLKPFMLRRLKRDVAMDLPDKIEQVSYCELTPDQKALYQTMLEAGRREVMEAVGSHGLQKSRMQILNVLLRLRQIACDLRLLNLEKVGESKEPSGKVDLFFELLNEAMDGGHRVLVFSQFVRMLTLLRERMDLDEIPYCYLDGSTVDRAGEVQRFQSSDQIPVFLISLKAGGVGLNLTGADTVIHFDPWWNPAIEDQATDRAHRIGQRRVVTSYKLIAQGTVEEKILHLQKKKRELIQGVLGDESSLIQNLQWDEIRALFD